MTGQEARLPQVLALLRRGRGREGEERRTAREARLAMLRELWDGPWFPTRLPRWEGEQLRQRTEILGELRDAGLVEEGFFVRSTGSRIVDGKRVETEYREDGWALTAAGRDLASELLPGLGRDDDDRWLPANISSFPRLRELSQDDRRRWLRGWMARVRLLTPAAAAEVLCVSRQTVDRMISPGSKERISITDATLRIAFLAERAAPNWD